MHERKQWLRGLGQAVVILGSILLAFGIEAWWDDRQETAHRAALLDDLEGEIALNYSALEAALQRQRLRSSRIQTLIGEIGADRVGLSTDSIRVLQGLVRNNPTYDPGFGVLNLLIQSGDLALLDDRNLRARLSGLDAFLDDYLGNQDILLELILTPAVLLETGSIVFDFSALSEDDLTLGMASEEVRENAGKFYIVTVGVTDLLIGQGETLLEELGEIQALLSER